LLLPRLKEVGRNDSEKEPPKSQLENLLAENNLFVYPKLFKEGDTSKKEYQNAKGTKERVCCFRAGLP
jgi:hypothetical protein